MPVVSIIFNFDIGCLIRVNETFDSKEMEEVS